VTLSTLLGGVSAQEATPGNVVTFGAPSAQRAQGEIGTLVNSPEVDRMAREAAANHRSVLAAPEVRTESAQSRATLQSAMNQVGRSLASGAHVTVSHGGTETIALVLELPRATPVRRQEILRKLVDALNEGQPEAQTSLGWIAEHGLFEVPRDINKAVRLYQAAAARRYQPAMFNLALIQAYGRSGGQPNEADALARLKEAISVGSEGSHRVCSLGAFLSYRASRPDDAQRFVNGCATPLGQLPVVAWSNALPMEERVSKARDSYATGIDDGIDVIVSITRATAASDPQQWFCKYRLIQLWPKLQGKTADAAKACFLQMSGLRPETALTPEQQSMVAGIGSFASMERDQLRRLRGANRFRYDLSVPFLPFRQVDLNSFEAALKASSSGAM
jgi:TPR repeat protein